MGMNVSYGVSGVNGVNNQPQKKANYGTKIGAGLGLAAGVARVFQTRGLVSDLSNQMLQAGLPKIITRVSTAVGVALALGLFTGAGALIGKGVQKLVNHFKKDEPKGVIPGKNPNPSNVKPDPALIEKYGANMKNVRTVTTKDKEEYVIVDGHPKEVYRKNPETGELEFKTSVCDGSWGPELSDEALIKSIKDTEKAIKDFEKNGKLAADVANSKVTDFSHIFQK